MANWSSGMRMRELGLGHSGVLPSDPDFPVVLHGQQSLESLSRILNKEATPEDLAVAQQLAAKNASYDTLIKEALAAGKANYGDQIKQQLENEYRGRKGRRMAGEGLAVLLAGVGGGLAADLLESDLIQIQDPNNYQASY